MTRFYAVLALVTPLCIGASCGIAAAEPKAPRVAKATTKEQVDRKMQAEWKRQATCLGRLILAFPETPPKVWRVLECTASTVMAQDDSTTFMLDKHNNIWTLLAAS